MNAGRVELFVNLMWRELDMAVMRARSDTAMARVVDLVFDGSDWREGIDAGTSDKRADQAVDLLARKLSGRWATVVRMLGDNRATRYMLLHLTNHDEGRDLMKECAWKVCPDGSFLVRKGDDPRQQVLISPRADLGPLRTWVLEQLSAGPLRWTDLHEKARPTVWRDTHVNEVVRGLRKSKEITATQFQGTFSIKANPLLSLATHATDRAIRMSLAAAPWRVLRAKGGGLP